MFSILKRYESIKKKRTKNKWSITIKSHLKKCGESTVLRYKSNFVYPDNIKIGDNVWIGENGWFQGIGGITIGSNVVISRNCTIFSGNHDYEAMKLPYDDFDVKKPIIIEDNVWIGMNVNIVPGVTIGEGAIIGMATTVTGDVPPLAIIGSTTHKILKFRDKTHYEKLKGDGRFRDVTKRA